MTIRIKSWGKFQHFKDRRPPWIKLHRESILDDLEWHQLDGEAAKALVSFWLLASENEPTGQLQDVKTLAFRLRKTESEISYLLDKLSHWLERDDINVISPRYQGDDKVTSTKHQTDAAASQTPKQDDIGVIVLTRSQETETETEAEAEAEERKDPPGAYAPAPPKGDALPEAGNPVTAPSEPPAAPPPPAAPVAPPVAPPSAPAEPVQRVSVFAAGAAKAKRSAREFDQPSWVPAAAWAEWLDYREEKAGGHTQWDFTVGEMRDVIRTLEKAMAIKGTTAAEELEDTRRAGLRKPNYFNGPDPTPTPPTLPTIAPAPPPLAPRVDPVLPVRPNRRNPAMHRPSDVGVAVWEQWCEFRRKKKAVVTEVVVEEIRNEATLAGLTLDAYLTKWLANGTTGFQAGYIKPAGQVGGFQPVNRQAALEARNDDVTDAYIKRKYGNDDDQ